MPQHMPQIETEIRPENERTTVYYDGSCPLCTAEIGHYASCTGAESLRFVDVSENEAELGDGLNTQQAMRRFHVRLADGTLVSGVRAFSAVWKILPRWQWAARFTQIPGATAVLEVAYRGFLPLRPFLSRLAVWFGAKPANNRASGL